MAPHGIPAWVLASTLLLACSRAPEAEREAAPTAEQETAAAPTPAPTRPAKPAAPESPTVGGDGSAIRLSALSSGEIDAADLSGELGCSFAIGRGETLLVAMGDVASDEPSFGAVKVGDYVETISARGGFDGMIKGATFAGQGKTVRIERTSPRPISGGESPPYPARLTYQRGDGASRSFEGLWTCGP